MITTPVSQDLIAALALVLVFEGIFPFIRPQKWRNVMSVLAKQPDQTLRWIGLGSMTLGLMLLFYVRQ